MVEKQLGGRTKSDGGPGPKKTCHMDDPLCLEDNDMGTRLMEESPDLEIDEWLEKFRSWPQTDLVEVAAATNAASAAVAAAIVRLESMTFRRTSSGSPIAPLVSSHIIDRTRGKPKSQDEKVPTLIAVFHGGTQNLLGIIDNYLSTSNGSNVPLDIREVHALPSDGPSDSQDDPGESASEETVAAGGTGEPGDSTGHSGPVPT